MQFSFPKMIVGDHATDSQIKSTGDGLDNERLYLQNSTLGTGVETLTVDADQNCLIMGPITVNCTLVINGTVKII